MPCLFVSVDLIFKEYAHTHICYLFLSCDNFLHSIRKTCTYAWASQHLLNVHHFQERIRGTRCFSVTSTSPPSKLQSSDIENKLFLKMAGFIRLIEENHRVIEITLKNFSSLIPFSLCGARIY